MKFVFCWLQLFLLLSGAAYAVDVEDFSEINGYTVIDITYVWTETSRARIMIVQ